MKVVYAFPIASRPPAAASKSSRGNGTADRDPGWRAWVRKRGKPVSQATGVNTSGLLEPARAAAAVVQRELHERPSPLAESRAVVLAAHVPEGAHYLGGNRLAKEVEASVAPHGQPLAICLGSTDPCERITTIEGPTRFYGCLHTFTDLPYGRGRRWPRQCPTCEPQRSNAKAKAITELQRRRAGS